MTVQTESLIGFSGYFLAALTTAVFFIKKLGVCGKCKSNGWLDYAVPAAGLMTYLAWGFGYLPLLVRVAAVVAHIAVIIFLSSQCRLCLLVWASSGVLICVELFMKLGTYPALGSATFVAALTMASLTFWKKQEENIVRSATVGLGAKRFVLVFTKEGCPFCEEFINAYTPMITKILGEDSIRIVQTNVPAWVTAFPTVIVSTPDNKRLFVGLPDPNEFSAALRGKFRATKETKKVQGRIVAYLSKGDPASDRFLRETAPRLQALVGGTNVLLLYHGAPAWVSSFPTLLVLTPKGKRVLEGIGEFKRIEAAL